ncbi:MAG TPA: beta-ketoacyl synthase N-terminal-like domain-containing protein, partial [Thermoanaerobaculia bacterium]|nr:beta-ketoacyl synthase N-terminal-like domain-containing protein [Thermoanaerobaculia bacterium]
MTDFIEYVVGELKSKRLSKTDAVALVRQFSLRAAGGTKASVLHPLLQSNTSDLHEQRYSSTFTGEEFFLTDHQVKAVGRASRKVLPGVAYLEMARAALEQAWPAGSAPKNWELRNTVWAQPIVIDATREISIALIANDDESVAYEIYSENGEEQVVHCQGRAVAIRQPEPLKLDLGQLEAQMERSALAPDSVYAAFAGMGLLYGPAFQGITTIHRGSGQVLARLRLPRVAEETAAEYVLHPSLMDSGLQAAVGLFENLSDISREPRLPFALESLRIVSPCSLDMAAWVRYAPGSQADDPVVKLDVDLCDEQGNVCVQMHGVSTRLLPSEQVLMRPPPEADPAVVATASDPDDLSDQTQDYLRKQLSGLLKLPAHEIDPRAALEKYGIDSILALKLTNQLENTFGSLSKTLFFEYQTIRELTEYFVAQYSPQLRALFGTAASRATVPAPSAAIQPPTMDVPASSRRANRRRSTAITPAAESDSIAIIGLSGRYPEAIDVAEYWRNLSEGKDCIIEVPKERWDWHEYFSDDRTKSGQHYSKWGGFIAGVDEFDPLFFNISPLEAELIDPQERLFLQHAWMAMEDAGYTRAGLQVPDEQDLPGQVGVYAGVMYSEYQLLAAESSMRGKRLGIAGSAASIANRVSYALNLHGPSMTLDTMCSSSLTAIHLACQDLKQGRTSLAIAGGVNVTIHPNKYLALSAGQFISSDGHCQSFGEGGDGYIPGEGVGTVVLKRLRDAERDGDHIYGVIRGSALTHGGKTNGYTVPNPQAQTSAISRALAESHTDPREISYIEAHGTGTKLGDPIEIAALSKAFHRYTQDTEFCRIGSAKSNIGHCESAAGIAGLTKVLLQMQHQQLVPSLHSAELNPHIDFGSSPFIVNQTLAAWEQPVIDGRALPRVAGISSFGAGGSNAHMIVEEYVSPLPQPQPQPMVTEPVVILLSAKTPERLQEKARDLLAFVRFHSGAIDLSSVAYTLQVGREAMESRLGFIVTSTEQLAEKLHAYVAGEQGIEDAYHGQVKRNSEALSLFSSDADLQQTLDKWIANRKLAKLLDLWVKGLELDWTKLYGAARPRRMSLPVYPFARERYWVDTAAGDRVAAATAVIHPLLHSNTSDLREQRYRSTFTGEEFFLADHQVKTDGRASRKVLPGVAYLEMARAAIEQALPAPPDAPVLELRNIIWSQPIVVTQATQVTIALSATDNDEIDYEIYSTDGEQEIVHGQGRAVWTSELAPATLDLAQLGLEMGRGTLAADAVYASAARMGIHYGPSFQGVTAVHRGTGQVLAQLRLPDAVEHTSAEYVLHPSLMDGALQAAIGLIDDTAVLSEEPRLPFALETLRVLSPCTSVMFAWVRHSPGSQAGDAVVKLDVDLCDERGNVCVQMHGFSSRVVGRSVAAAVPANGELLATPVWHAAEAFTGTNIDYTAYHVVLCELPAIEVATLQRLLSGTEWLSLERTQYDSIERRYSHHAVACFERIQGILQSKPHGKVLVQIVVADDDEQALFAGLSGLLKTAALENPKLVGQVLLVAGDTRSEELAERLLAERRPRVDAMVKVEQGVRKV